MNGIGDTLRSAFDKVKKAFLDTDSEKYLGSGYARGAAEEIKKRKKKQEEALEEMD